MLLLLAAHPGGLSLDALWPAMRTLVRSRPGSYSPVNAGPMDKPDRVMQRVIRTAGFETLRGFLETLPAVALSVRAPELECALWLTLRRRARAPPLSRGWRRARWSHQPQHLKVGRRWLS